MSQRRRLALLLLVGVCVLAAAAPGLASPKRYSVTVEINGLVPDQDRYPGFPQKTASATGVNNAGTLSGWLEYYPTDYSTVAWAGGEVSAFLGGLSSKASAINVAGVAVGSASVAGLAELTPVAWKQG